MTCDGRRPQQPLLMGYMRMGAVVGYSSVPGDEGELARMRELMNVVSARGEKTC